MEEVREGPVLFHCSGLALSCSRLGTQTSGGSCSYRRATSSLLKVKGHLEICTWLFCMSQPGQVPGGRMD